MARSWPSPCRLAERSCRETLTIAICYTPEGWARSRLCANGMVFALPGSEAVTCLFSPMSGLLRGGLDLSDEYGYEANHGIRV